MNRRRLFGAAAAFAATRPSLLAGQTLERIAAGATPVEGDAVIFLAQADGYFARVGIALDIQKLTSGEANAAALAAGDVAVGSMNTMSLAIAHQNGIDLKIIAAGVMYESSHSGAQMLVAKSSSVTSGRDLNGKIFAVNVLHGSAQLFAQSWIDRKGGDSTTLRWIELPFSLMEAALVAGRIDAALVLQPFATIALATCRSLGSPGDGIAPRFMNGAYAVTATWLAAHRETAARINSVLSRASHAYNANPAGSVQAIAELTKQDPAVVARSVRAIFGEKVEASLLQPVIDVGARYGLLKRPFPAKDIIAQLPHVDAS